MTKNLRNSSPKAVSFVPKLFEYWDTHYGINRSIFFEYKSEAYLRTLLIYGLGYFQEEFKGPKSDLQKLQDENFLNTLIQEWITQFKLQRALLSLDDLDSHDKVVIAWIDSEFGTKAGCSFEDYDSGNDLFRIVQDEVACQDHLTLGCGVGPLNRALVYWIQQFEAIS